MSQTSPTISVVIPVYNEERLIAHCLDALQAQTVTPHEIIIVDNNSSDRTIEIAKKYPLVRVVSETKQGITYARTTGFNSVQGDIIARLDADSIVKNDWVATLTNIFADSSVGGVTGNAAVAEVSPKGRFWLRWYYPIFRAWHQRSIGFSPVLYGFNSALRANAWEVARQHTTDGDHGISEDLDVTLALVKEGFALRYEPKLLVKCHVLRSLSLEKARRYYRTDGHTLKKYQVGNKQRWI